MGPQFYRKVALNGRLLFDTEPYLHKRTDVEPETTCIDALTLQLRHQTSDIHVPLMGTDFALAVRRNVFASFWQEGGLTASQRPDLPFGDCWLSGLAANVHVVDRGVDHGTYVFVTDEQGTLHKFVEFYKNGNHAGYYPLPSSDVEQDARSMVLLRKDGRLEFKRKYGTTLWFSFDRPCMELKTTFGLINERHLYYRLERANDRRGGYLLYQFGSNNRGLVPDEISFASRRMLLHRNQRGQIECIVDPRGAEHRYEYREPILLGGASLLVRKYNPSREGGVAYTSYDYEELCEETSPGPKEMHVALSLVSDPLQNSYQIFHRHQFGFRRDEDVPLYVSKVILPNRMGVAEFYDYSQASGAGKVGDGRLIFVVDASRNGRLHEFSDRETIVLSGLPWRKLGKAENHSMGVPQFTIWKCHQVSYYQGSRHRFDVKERRFCPHFLTRLLLRERYEFDVGAGMALSRAVDGEGSVTSFHYQDRFIRSFLMDALPEGFYDPFSCWWQDVTETRNPLGGVKRFAYHSGNRALIRKEDELGHRTVFKVNDVTGLPLTETVYNDQSNELNDEPFARTEFKYDDDRFPGFLTRKVIRKTKAYKDVPNWEVDLVRIFMADENGNLVREVADPDVSKFTWIYSYDGSNNRISAQYPDGYFIQYRFDSLNRMIRVYRSRGSVKKYYYNLRGMVIREVESNGDTSTFVYDALNRLLQKTVEKGPHDKREKTTDIFRYNAVNSKRYESLSGKTVKRYSWDGLQRVVRIQDGFWTAWRYQYSLNGSSNLFRSSRLCPTCSWNKGISPRLFHVFNELQQTVRESRSFICLFGFSLFSFQKLFFTYDLAGNLLTETCGKSTTRYEYDALNRLTLKHQPDGGWKLTLRTSTGLEYGFVDSSGKRKEKCFDAAGDEVSP